MTYEYDEPEEAPASPESKGSITVSPMTVDYEARAVFDSVVRTVSHTIKHEIHHDVRKAVLEQANEQINEKVGDLIEAAMVEGIQVMNSYGEPIGPRTTLKAMIGAAGEKYLGTKVDKSGSATSYNADRTRLEFLINKAVEEHIDYRLKQEIDKAVKLATAQATAKIGEVIGSLIIKLA